MVACCIMPSIITGIAARVRICRRTAQVSLQICILMTRPSLAYQSKHRRARR
jgi:hypothetical protein